MSGPSYHSISSNLLDLDDLHRLQTEGHHLALSEESRGRVRRCREYLDGKVGQPDRLYYGINTGFGSLCNVAISPQDIERLQYNLLVSHAVGAGDLVPPEIARLMLALKIQGLSQGYSGVREVVIDRLIDFYNAGLAPVVFELGSLGASGDLAPLAHLSLPLAGLGELWRDGRRERADAVLQQYGWPPLRFQAKEALALLNGTQFSAAYAVWCLLEGRRLARLADFNAATGYEAFNCRLDPLHELLHRIRPHAGQIRVAADLRRWLEGSAIAAAEKTSVQDPYAFRCVPQVHGASYDAMAHAWQQVATEINAVTDNPNVFPEEDLILSGGNFHAQPLALPLDYLAIAFSELGSISERRVYQLLSGQRGLPPFLTDNPGLHSGLMIAQYTAAAIVNQNKTLCTPASADSIVSCNGQEDHVSMAANAATKLRRVVLNLERLLAIEFMTVHQALDYRRPLQSAPAIAAVHDAYRRVVPRLEEDRVLHYDLEATITFLRSSEF
jgi:histidine ammonia-lyase